MSKEKQIEEIAKVISDEGCKEIPVNECDSCDSCAACEAERLYNAGYRKQSEGEWIFNRGRTYGESAYYCSKCSEGASEYGYDKYCPNCGAKMKGGTP